MKAVFCRLCTFPLTSLIAKIDCVWALTAAEDCVTNRGMFKLKFRHTAALGSFFLFTPHCFSHPHRPPFSSLTTMLGIQELDDAVCQELSHHDLTQCAQVSKKWHSIVIPHLWRDLTWLEQQTCRTNLQEFIQFVAEDYLEEQQRQVLPDEGHSMEQSSQIPPPSSHMSALSKYGQWIRLLPRELYLRDAFLAYSKSRNGLDAFEPFLHLCRRCSPDHVQMTHLSIYTGYLDLLPPDDTQRMIVDFLHPRTHKLSIYGRQPTSMSQIASMLGQRSVPLRKLRLDRVQFSDSEMFELEKEPVEYEAKNWTSFKELVLDSWSDNPFWWWLFRRCTQVEVLEARINGAVQVLAQAMMTYMPRLTNIHLEGEGSDVATLLSASKKGWKSVRLGTDGRSEREVMEALEKHFPTLESFGVSDLRSFPSEDAVHLLRSCPHLQTYINSRTYKTLDIMVFTDRDPNAGSLRPWKCERTLKELRVFLSNLPRTMEFPEEAWFIQRSEIQHGIYDRLARLTQLEVFQLGGYIDWMGDEYLEMTLESGLHKLAGLKKLKELYIGITCAKIGIKEVQWMVKNWPRICVIDGLVGDGDNEKAAQWLSENHPTIRSSYL